MWLNIPIEKFMAAAGKRINSSEALACGLADHAVEAGGGYARALDMARDIAKGAPTALRLAKAAVSQVGREGQLWHWPYLYTVHRLMSYVRKSALCCLAYLDYRCIHSHSTTSASFAHRSRVFDEGPGGRHAQWIAAGGSVLRAVDTLKGQA